MCPRMERFTLKMVILLDNDNNNSNNYKSKKKKKNASLIQFLSFV